MFLRGLILALLHLLVFAVYYVFDFAPGLSTIVVKVSLFAIFISFVIREYFANQGRRFFKAFFYFLIILVSSSFFYNVAAYCFNNYVDKEFKYIQEQREIDLLNARRDRLGIHYKEYLDKGKVDKEYSTTGYLSKLATGGIINLIVALLAFPGGLIYSRIFGPSEAMQKID
jgi:di/tricarboxylate transporter